MTETDKQPPEPICKIISRNLRHLFTAYGGTLGIPEGTSNIVNHYNKLNVELSPTTIRGFLEGNASNRPQEATLNDLVFPFSKTFPRIEGSWLLTRDPKTFLELLGNRNLVQIEVPSYDDRVPSLAKWIAGTYVAYRFAFEGEDDRDVSREVLHIWLDGSVLRFRMSYWSRTSEPGQEALEFLGLVLPVGQSIFFVGLSTNQAQRDRGRSLFLHDDRAHPKLRNCALGLLSSTRLHGDWAPCVACTLLIRMEKEPANLTQFIQDASLIDSSGTLLGTDFGEKHRLWIEAFLDNRPRGSIKEPALADLDGKPGIREPVLRLNRGRFNENMPGILEDVMKDPGIRAPFKANWNPSQQGASEAEA